MAHTSKLEEMTVDDVCEWLEDKDYPDSVVQCFKDQEMDGSAIGLGLASAPGPEWLKDVVPVLGQRLKVYNHLRTLYNENQIGSPEGSYNNHSRIGSPESGVDFNSPPGSSVSAAGTKSAKSSSFGGSRATPTRKVASLPNPFPIPTFRPATERKLTNQQRNDGDRKYIVQTLATVLMTYVQKPSVMQCGVVAKAFVDKFPFLKDDGSDGGDGENVNRNLDDETPRKKRKMTSTSAHIFLAPVNAEDDVSYGRNLETLSNEASKPKPRIDVLKELMRRTFPNRWDCYVNQGSPGTLLEYLQEFPLLKKTLYTSQDFALICQKEDIRDCFEDAFPKWAHAIEKYCRDTQVRSTAIQLETCDYEGDFEDDRVAMLALRCLALLFAPIKTKKLSESIPYIIKIVPRGTPTKEALDKETNQPYIVLFRDEDDVLQQYFICVEQQLMLECSTLVTALLMCIAAHYVFNLCYHRKSGDVWVFLQEKVIGLPSKQETKKSPSASAHFAGIQNYFPSATTTTEEDVSN